VQNIADLKANSVLDGGSIPPTSTKCWHVYSFENAPPFEGGDQVSTERSVTGYTSRQASDVNSANR